ncbi:hypothetical protein [Nocardia cyriacigeorgica]|uniref:hypothetical protein n=1 Tax=Nocardia cyriacigeorgica TaxID=135487 RepID=UPI002457E9A6|nr:hypothetical protein [Nocardia cyriacigeorgica]
MTTAGQMHRGNAVGGGGGGGGGGGVGGGCLVGFQAPAASWSGTAIPTLSTSTT